MGAISLATALFLDITGAPFAIFLGFAVIGIVFEWAERRALGPVWLLLTLLAIPTPAPAVGDASLVEIPMAMLIGIAVVEVVAPAVMSTTPSVDRTRVLIVGLLGAGLLAAVGFPMATQTGLYALTVEQRAAMRWVAESLPVNARFAVVNGHSGSRREQAFGISR